MNETNETNETITPKGDSKSKSIAMDWPIMHKVYKAVVEYEMRGETERINLFTQAPGFEVAKTIFSHTDYMAKWHGHFVSIAEVAGCWVE